MVSPPLSAFPPGLSAEARFGSTLPHSDSAYDLESSLSSGTLAKFGSALKAYRSVERQLLGLDKQVQYLGIGRAQRGERLTRGRYRHARFENVEHLVGGPGLRWRRQREHVITVIARTRRSDPFTAVVCEILQRHRATESIGLLYDRLRDFSLIEGTATLLLQDSKGLCEPRITVNLSGNWRATVDVPRCDRVRIQLTATLPRIARCPRHRVGQNPFMRDALGNWKPLLRIVDRRLQCLFERQCAKATLQFVPTPCSSWHRDR